MTESPSDGFREIEVRVATEAAAAAEAGRRQLLEPDADAVEWIYLRNQEGQWVARRVLRDGAVRIPEVSRTSSRLRKIGEFVLGVITYQP